METSNFDYEAVFAKAMHRACSEWLKLLDSENELDPVKRCPRCAAINEAPALHCNKCRKRWEKPFGHHIKNPWESGVEKMLRDYKQGDNP